MIFFIGGLAVMEYEGPTIFADRLDVLQVSLLERGLEDAAKVVAEAQRRLLDLLDEVDHLQFQIDSHAAHDAVEDDEEAGAEADRVAGAEDQTDTAYRGWVDSVAAALAGLPST